MNVPVPPPGPAGKQTSVKCLKMRRVDHTFLPGALEILETPPAPLAIIMIGVIALFVVIALVWTSFGRIDIIAVAQGKVEPNGGVKTIQALEAGRVLINESSNGRHVSAGDLLIALDSREAQAERGAILADLQSYRGEVFRRRAAIETAGSGGLDPSELPAGKGWSPKDSTNRLINTVDLEESATHNSIPSLGWPSDLPASMKVREERVLQAELTQLVAQLALFDAQAVQKDAERQKLAATTRAQQELIATLQERVDMRQALQHTNAFSKSNMLDALQMLRSQQETLVEQTGQMGEIEANLEVIARDRQKTLRSFIADNSEKLDEAERQVGDLSEKLAHANAKLSNMVIKSPISGIAQSSIITTEGQVVSPGEELMRIVPDSSTLEVESYLANEDVAFVKAGQTAILKVTSVPFTRYGTIEAVVTRVAHDAIPEPDATQAEQDPARPRQSPLRAGGDRVQNLVYAVTLKPLQTSINVDGTAVSLQPGMEVTSEIRTGSRSIISYLFSPLAQVKSEALRER